MARELARALRKRMTDEERRMEGPHVKGTSSGNQPVYALLNPGTSFAGLAQAKAASKPRLHKPKLQELQKVEVSQARVAKVTARPRK